MKRVTLSLLVGALLSTSTTQAIQLLAQTPKAGDADTYFDYLTAELSSALGDKAQAYRSYERILGRNSSSEVKRGYIRLPMASTKK